MRVYNRAVMLLAAAVAAGPWALLARGQSVAAIGAGAGRNVGFDEQWKFFKGDEARAKEAGFDDGAWRVLDLPHDWSVESPFDRTLASCTAFLPCGIGWYRKGFALPAEAKGKEISIRFDGVMNHSTVYCNGKEVGGRPYGYSSFTVDLTGAVKFGEANEIAVRVDHEQYADSRWYAGSGIYRNVWLNVTDAVHVDVNGIFVTTPKVTAEAAQVHVETVVKNDGAADAGDVTVTTTILDAKGAKVGAMVQTGGVGKAGEKVFAGDVEVAKPEMWMPGKPVMYSVHTEVKRAGKVIDQTDSPFGIRSFVFDANKGFSINGVGMKLKGVCLHHDAGALGAAVPIEVWERRLGLLQAAGCNAIRCSHNPPAPEFLDLCDRMGFLVMDEAFDEWTQGKHKWIVGHNAGTPGTDGYHSDFDKWADVDIKDMVVRDRNHPSIVMWSIGNEIDYTNDPFPTNSQVLPPVAARLIKDVKNEDVTRPVTAACAFPATNLYKQLLDIEGYNYMERLYAGDHAADPTRVMFGSENSQALASWQSVAQNDYIAGQFLWTGIDYLGEAGVWPSHGSGAGLMDLAGFPKNQYYFRASLWAEEPMAFLSTTGIGGRGRGRGGQGAISCFTNCDSVELFHDGVTLGSKPHGAAGDVVTWPLDFASGVLKVVGKKGTATTTFELKKAGAAAAVAVHADVAGLRANGKDVVQIEVDVTDKDGTRVPDAANELTCAISGPGKIIGIENGDLNSVEAFKSLSRKANGGRMMVYVQALKEAGEVTLTVSGANLEGGKVTMGVK